MDEAEKLRRQAKRAMRLAEALSDQYSTQALKTHAATLLERAESLEQGAQTVLSAQQPQQQQQGKPTKKKRSQPYLRVAREAHNEASTSRLFCLGFQKLN